ncbi:MAG: peptidylprolyl isomerase [Aureispira sp.]|nr:peptidylprolyl isomerase [Aureispira sp.]
MKTYTLLFFALLLWTGCQTDNSNSNNNNNTTPIEEKEPRQRVEINTPYGPMVIELYNETPKHRDNFIKLAKEGFYDSLMFHRVQQNFMIQGGDPDSRGEVHPAASLGQGTPAYTIPAEIAPQFIHRLGAVSAYHEGKKKVPTLESNGSQFLIIHGQPLRAYQLEQIQKETGIKYSAEQIATYEKFGGVPSLDQKHTIFGQVVEGLDIIAQIATTKTMRMEDPIMPDRPVEDIRMTVKVLEPQE